MKKIAKRIALVVLAVTAVYTAIAWFLLRGLGAYRLGTTVGMILSHSWQYTGLAALVLAAWAVISSLLRRKKGDKIAAAAPDGSAVQPAPEEKKARRGKKGKAASDRIRPARPEGKLAPAAPAAEGGETAPMPGDGGQAGATMPMPDNVGEAGATMPMPGGFEAADETLPMPEDVGETGATALMPEDAGGAAERQAFCPNCHAAVKPGAKFCVKCGARLGG